MTVLENPFVTHGGLGYWSEPELGLTYVRQRWLDTASGQWLSVDPVEGEPRYSYAYNSPTRFVDPAGNAPPGVGMLFSTRPFEIAAKTWEGLERWMYTGDASASDEVYDAALNQAIVPLNKAIATLKTGTALIRSTKQHWLDDAQRIIVRWTVSQSGHYERNFATIHSALRHVPYVAWIPRSVLNRLERLFSNKASRLYKNTRERLPMWLRLFVPPYPGTRAEFQYKVGFLWGLTVSVIDFFDLVSQIGGLFDAMLFIAEQEPNLWELLWNMAGQYLSDLKSKATNGNLSVFQQGKIAAMIRFDICLIVLLVVDVAGALAKAGSTLGKMAQKVAQAAENNKQWAALIQKVKAARRTEQVKAKIKGKVEAELPVLNTTYDLEAILQSHFGRSYRNLVQDVKVKENLRTGAGGADDALAAFESETKTIFVSHDFFVQSELMKEKIMLHEFGHAIQFDKLRRLYGFKRAIELDSFYKGSTGEIIYRIREYDAELFAASQMKKWDELTKYEHQKYLSRYEKSLNFLDLLDKPARKLLDQSLIRRLKQ